MGICAKTSCSTYCVDVAGSEVVRDLLQHLRRDLLRQLLRVRGSEDVRGLIQHLRRYYDRREDLLRQGLQEGDREVVRGLPERVRLVVSSHMAYSPMSYSETLIRVLLGKKNIA